VVSIVMFDIDHFKQVNDVHGHDAGDQVLRKVSREAAQDDAVIGRLGGEEFAILLDGWTLSQAAALAERLRVRISVLNFDTDAGGLSVTCSFGVAERIAGETIDHILKRADVALYAAKQGGRNQVVTADAASAAMPRPANSVVRAKVRVSAGPAAPVMPSANAALTFLKA